MGLFLHFGAGPNQLPPPWQNLTAEHDIRRPLRFELDSASAILAEHVIEHVSFVQGFAFLDECRRVLEPGGVLRLGFPDVGRFLLGPIERPELTRSTFELGARAFQYAEELERRGVVSYPHEADRAARARAGLRLLLKGFHHQCAWTEATAAGVLLALGFRDVRRCDYGAGELGHCDGHHKDAGRELATLETTIFEAHK